MSFSWLTFEELLAGVFLEKGFVGYGADEVFKHEQEDRLDLVLGIAGVFCKSRVL